MAMANGVASGAGVTRGAVALILTAACAWSTAQAQSWPSRPMRAVVPYGPGSGVDVVARIITEPLGKVLGQNIVVENRAGASGTIATANVVNSPADGHTLLFDSSAQTSVPATMLNMPFDTARDIAGVTTLIENPIIIVAAASKGYKTIADLVAAGKARPGALNFSSAGVATSSHIVAEKLRLAAGFTAVHVPFKSTTDALTEVLAGRIDFLGTALGTALANIKDGRLIGLAMTSRRTKVLPDVPGMADAGLPAAVYSSWLGMMVHGRTSRELVNRLHAETVRLLGTPDVIERLARIGAEPLIMSPEEFDAMRRRELVENAALMKAIGITPQ